MTYFTDCKTLDELKKEYRRLAILHHPDRGGDLETMKAMSLKMYSKANVITEAECVRMGQN